MSSASVRRLTTPLTLREGVAGQLRSAIITGDLAPGALLKETELALKLGVSATPVREALGDLSAEGLVEVQTHRLKRVAPIELPATLDLLKVQSALWRMGYVWGFPKIGAAEIFRLDGAVNAYQAALETGDFLSAIGAAHAFHTVFIEASGNSELLRVTLDRRSLIARFILLRGRSTVSKNGLRQHRAMLEAFAKGDTDAVLALLDQVSARLLSLAEP